MEVKRNPVFNSPGLSLKKFAIPILLLFSCSNKKQIPQKSTYNIAEIIYVGNTVGVKNERLFNINKTLKKLQETCGPEIKKVLLYQEPLEKDVWIAGHADQCGCGSIQINDLLVDPIFEHVMYHEQGHRQRATFTQSEKEGLRNIFDRIQKKYSKEQQIYDKILKLENYDSVYVDNEGIGEYPIETLMENHEEFFAHMFLLSNVFDNKVKRKIEVGHPIQEYIDKTNVLCGDKTIAVTSNSSLPHISL